VFCLRQGNKLVSKNVYIDSRIDLAQKISKKEEEDKANFFERNLYLFYRMKGKEQWKQPSLFMILM